MLKMVKVLVMDIVILMMVGLVAIKVGDYGLDKVVYEDMVSSLYEEANVDYVEVVKNHVGSYTVRYGYECDPYGRKADYAETVDIKNVINDIFE